MGNYLAAATRFSRAIFFGEKAVPKLALFDYDAEPWLKTAIKKINNNTFEICVEGKTVRYRFLELASGIDWVGELVPPTISIDKWQQIVGSLPDAKIAGRKWDKRRSYRRR